jgi:hypothetical protein
MSFTPNNPTKILAVPAALHNNMNPGSLKSRSDFEIAAKLACSRSYTAETNPHPHRRPMISHATTIVSDYHVHPTTDPPQLDRSMWSTCMAMDIRQTFLNHSKERPLHATRQFIDLRTRPDTNDKTCALGVAVDVPTDSRTKSIDVETERMQQIAQSADFLEDHFQGGLNLIPQPHLIACQGDTLPKTHQVEVGGDKMLRGWVVQFLCDTLALFLL